MPAGSIKVPHYPQSRDGACLPACVRMVLTTFGEQRSEAAWAKRLGSYEYGTPSSRVTRLASRRYEVEYRSFSLVELKNKLEQGLYPIVFVYAGFLDWADFEGFHALVLVEITEDSVWLHDPSLATGPTQLSIDGFLLTWEEFDNLLL